MRFTRGYVQETLLFNRLFKTVFSLKFKPFKLNFIADKRCKNSKNRP